MQTRPALLCLALALVIVTGCRRDRLFTDDPGARLSFSQDTVMFDTVFTTVGTVTKYFVARNPQDRAVRVQVVLEGGAPSPFRINVDGASGTEFHDVEIPAGDSVFVFVEATLGPGSVNTPFIIEDHIAFVTNGHAQRILLVAWGQDAYFHHIGPDSIQIEGFPPIGIVAGGKDENGQQICETVTWTNDKPHVIFGYAVVDSCSTLEIQPGTRIHVHGGGGLWIYRWGRLLAQGQVDLPITFQSDRLEPLYAELPGQWDRIWINDGPDNGDHILEHVRIKNALIGIQCENAPWLPEAPVSAARLVLNNVGIRNCSAAGVLSRNFRITSNNLRMGDCGQHALALTGGGQYYFNHTTIANYWDYEIRQTPSFIMTNTYQDLVNGTMQVREIVDSQFLNGIIEGGNTNEFQLVFDAALTPQFKFEHFLFRTDQPTDDPTWFPVQSTIHRNVEPGFVSVTDRDFRLTEAAFARNKGTSSTAEAIEDIEGNMRNCDALGYDLGCYEWCP